MEEDDIAYGIKEQLRPAAFTEASNRFISPVEADHLLEYNSKMFQQFNNCASTAADWFLASDTEDINSARLNKHSPYQPFIWTKGKS